MPNPSCISAKDFRPRLFHKIDERLEQLYPDEYKEYRRRWLALPEDERPGRMYDLVDWRVLVIQLAKSEQLAQILGGAVRRQRGGNSALATDR